jgi:LPXTG-motif cell wall-anchored protein
MAAVAKANGRELPDAPGTGGGGSDTTTIIVIVGAVALALAGIALFIRGRRGPPAPATGAA